MNRQPSSLKKPSRSRGPVLPVLTFSVDALVGTFSGGWFSKDQAMFLAAGHPSSDMVFGVILMSLI